MIAKVELSTIDERLNHVNLVAILNKNNEIELKNIIINIDGKRTTQFIGTYSKLVFAGFIDELKNLMR